MPRIYTEIRIAHDSPEAKKAYEAVLDQTITGLGYKSRTEWFNDKVRKSRKEYLELKRKESAGIIEKLKGEKGKWE
jgi:metal-responsive CopG/Arc/MetJ family transcriptional regulator